MKILTAESRRNIPLLHERKSAAVDRSVASVGLFLPEHGSRRIGGNVVGLRPARCSSPEELGRRKAAPRAHRYR
jgi:hypothetical protein